MAILLSVGLGVGAAWLLRPAQVPALPAYGVQIPAIGGPAPDAQLLREALLEHVIEDARSGVASPAGLPALSLLLRRPDHGWALDRLAEEGTPPALLERLARDVARTEGGDSQAIELLAPSLRSGDGVLVRRAIDTLRTRELCRWERDVGRALSFGACILGERAWLFVTTLDGRGDVTMDPVAVDGGWDLRARRVAGDSHTEARGRVMEVAGPSGAVRIMLDGPRGPAVGIR